MVNDSSLPVGGTSVFDLDSHAGITQLLVSVRTSTLSAEQKNDIRDLVFQYTNGGKDVTVKRALEQKITAADLHPAAPKAATPPPPPPPLIGTFRSAPVFVPPPAPTTEVEVRSSKKEQSEQTLSISSVAIPEVTTKIPEPVKEQELASQSISQEPAVSPVSKAEEDEAQLTPEPLEEIPVAPPVSNPVPIQSLDDNQAYLNRIREIKSTVNDRVGNPVHLVDIDNQVGREYMSALLEAMKKLNSGSSPAQAMQRLEAAFTAVKETLDKHDSGAVSDPAPVATPVQSEVVEHDSNEPESFVTKPVSVTLPVTPVPPQTPENIAHGPVAPAEPVPVVSPAPTIDTSAWKSVAPIVPTAPIQPTSQPTTPPAPTIDTSAWQSAAPVNPSIPTVVSSGVPAPNTDTRTTGWNAVPTTPIAHSIAESPLPKTPDSLPLTRQPEKAVPTGDILYTEEVDQGLEQLLLEWSLFKKSGLFGTGPKGREHPLFKKIADLQIPLLLAGRFEGATQETKQSITDYMNGWRYEQGIIYEPGELFEHYLRRVIRHILDLQKTKIR